jgi:hypothetical protein
MQADKRRAEALILLVACDKALDDADLNAIVVVPLDDLAEFVMALFGITEADMVARRFTD